MLKLNKNSKFEDIKSRLNHCEKIEHLTVDK